MGTFSSIEATRRGSGYADKWAKFLDASLASGRKNKIIRTTQIVVCILNIYNLSVRWRNLQVSNRKGASISVLCKKFDGMMSRATSIISYRLLRVYRHCGWSYVDEKANGYWCNGGKDLETRDENDERIIISQFIFFLSEENKRHPLSRNIPILVNLQNIIRTVIFPPIPCNFLLQFFPKLSVCTSCK